MPWIMPYCESAASVPAPWRFNPRDQQVFRTAEETAHKGAAEDRDSDVADLPVTSGFVKAFGRLFARHDAIRQEDHRAGSHFPRCGTEHERAERGKDPKEDDRCANGGKLFHQFRDSRNDAVSDGEEISLQTGANRHKWQARREQAQRKSAGKIQKALREEVRPNPQDTGGGKADAQGK